MMTPCSDRLVIIQRSPTSDHPDIYACRLHGYCTLEPSTERTVKGPIRDCQTCQSEAKPVVKEVFSGDLAWLGCPHRGEATDDRLNCGCNIDRTIYHCAIKGKCIKRLPPGYERATFADELDGVTVCKTECQAWRK